jgi:hypothetical protein
MYGIQGIDRVRRSTPRDLHCAGGEAGLAVDQQLRHAQAMLGPRIPLGLLVWGRMRRHQHDAIDAELVEGASSEGKVSEVRRIERPTEDAERPSVRSRRLLRRGRVRRLRRGT